MNTFSRILNKDIYIIIKVHFVLYFGINTTEVRILNQTIPALNILTAFLSF